MAVGAHRVRDDLDLGQIEKLLAAIRNAPAPSDDLKIAALKAVVQCWIKMGSGSIRSNV